MQTKRTKIRDVLLLAPPVSGVRIKGWARTVRDSKNVVFVAVNDGSCLASLQVVVGPEVAGFSEAQHLTTGSAVEVIGELVPSPAKGQPVELRATELEVIGRADPSFPLQKKRHSFEFLREIAHLRVRTNTFGAVFRMRSALAQGVHRFFAERRFAYVHTPILTASDCEGAGEMFQVTTLDLANPPRKEGRVDFDTDFFAKPAMLTVSGQLNGECYAMGLGEIYTFGPTFRAENSNTSRHAAEFWMIEPEAAFYDLDDDMTLAEDFVKYLLRVALEECAEDLAFFDEHVEKGLIARLRAVAEADFARISYTEAVSILEKSGRAFEFPVAWGKNLQAEHERYLTEEAIGKPTFVVDYPKEIKAFYMRRNDDGKTVAAMDLLVPGIGELIGGSQREERLDVLERVMREHGLSVSDYEWYLDTRRFGTTPHAGFGLGFERLLMYVTGMENIRDVIPFPRTPRHCTF
ncbi:MAG: asparagine--tRNA ligase [Polyangiales bacterium]